MNLKTREVATECESTVTSAQYRAMKKLMALVDTKSFDSIEEFTELAEYFPAMYNSMPEYHAITQAFVSAFRDAEDSNLRKADHQLLLHVDKQYMFRSIIASMNKAVQQERNFVKLRAAKVVPIQFDVVMQKRLSTLNDEMIASTFCVESCKAARVRRLIKQFNGAKLIKLHSAKVVPCLFMSQTRNIPIRTKNNLGEIAAMFCVENKENATIERTIEIEENHRLVSAGIKYDADRIPSTSRVFENLHLHSDDIGFAGSNNESGDDITQLSIADIKAGADTDDDVNKNAIDNVDEKRKLEHKGRFLRCLSAIRKLLKKKE